MPEKMTAHQTKDWIKFAEIFLFTELDYVICSRGKFSPQKKDAFETWTVKLPESN